MRFWILIAVLGLLPALAFAQVQTFRKEVKQVMGSAQSPDDARAAAVAKAKRDALEEAGTWLESQTEVKNLNLARDDVTALASGVTQTRILEEQPFVEGTAMGLRVVAEVRVDNSGLKERVRLFLADRQRLEQAKSVNAREKELLARLAELERQMADMKARGESTTDLRGAVQENARGLTAQEWYEKGTAGWEGMKFADPQQAIAYFSEALRLDPNFTFAYTGRGIVYANLGQYQRAIQDYDQALRLDPNSADVYGARGVSYARLGQHQRAIQDYDQTLRLDPSNAVAYAGRGAAYLDLGQHQRAIQDHDQALRLDPNNASAYARRGLTYSGLGQHQRAIQDYDQALRLDPNNAVAYVGRGAAYRGLGQRSRAYADVRKACALGLTAACDWLRKNPE